jgi:hypothetical protein
VQAEILPFVCPEYRLCENARSWQDKKELERKKQVREERK